MTTWDRRAGSKRQQGIVTPKRPKTLRQRNAAIRITDKDSAAKAAARAYQTAMEKLGWK